MEGQYNEVEELENQPSVSSEAETTETEEIEEAQQEEGLTKPYHLDPRFQELVKQRDEIKRERDELAERLEEVKALKEEFYEGPEEEGSIEDEDLKKKVADLENQVYQQRTEQEFRDLLPKFPTISATDEDRTLIKGLMYCYPKDSMKDVMIKLHQQRENQNKKIIEGYLASKKVVKGTSLGISNVSSLVQGKEPETLDEAKKIAKKLLSEVS